MAKATKVIHRVETTEEERRAHARLTVEQALAEHADGVVDTLELLGRLHQAGVLQMGRALFERGQEILEIVTRQAEKPGSVLALKNVIALGQGLSQVDPKTLSHVFDGLKYVQTNADRLSRERATSVGTLWRAMRDPDVATGLAMMVSVLKGIGMSIRGKDGETGGQTRFS